MVSANDHDNARNSESTHVEPGSDTEKNGEDKGPPKPVPLWHHELHHVRWQVLRQWALTTTVLMVAILAVLSIYWGALSHVNENLSSLVIAVVNFDGEIAPYNTSGITPVIGPLVIEMTVAAISTGQPHLGYIPLTAADFDYDPMQVRQAVYDEHYWGAIIINGNATTALTNAVQTGDASYEPIGACQLIFEQARDDTTWDNFIYPYLAEFQTDVTSAVGLSWATTVLKEASTNTTLLANIVKAPQTVSPAIGFSVFDLRPFYPYQLTPTVSVGLIYLLIMSFFSFTFYIPVYSKLIKPEGHPPLHFWQMVIVRYFGVIGAYFFLSLAYSLLSLAFEVNFSTRVVTTDTSVVQIADGNAPKYGAATFPVYWCLNWCGMMALGLACENVAMIIGQPWTALWLIFWVISNVSTAFYTIDIEPHFYYWGYAWPLHNVVEGTRALIFDLHNRLGLNFGVLIAWAAVNTVLFPFCCRFMKYKNMHQVKEYWA